MPQPTNSPADKLTSSLPCRPCVLQNGHQGAAPASATAPPAKPGPGMPAGAAEALLPLPHHWPAQEQQQLLQQQPLQGPSSQSDAGLAHMWWQQQPQPPLEQQQAGSSLSDGSQEVWLQLQVLQQTLGGDAAHPAGLPVAAGWPQSASVQHPSAAGAVPAQPSAVDTALGLLDCGIASAAPAAAAAASMPAPGGAIEAGFGSQAPDAAPAAAAAAAVEGPLALAGGAGRPSQYTAVVQLGGRWQLDGWLHTRGPFGTEEAAAAAYDRAVLAQLGALLRLNFPLESYIKV